MNHHRGCTTVESNIRQVHLGQNQHQDDDREHAEQHGSKQWFWSPSSHGDDRKWGRAAKSMPQKCGAGRLCGGYLLLGIADEDDVRISMAADEGQLRLGRDRSLHGVQRIVEAEELLHVGNLQGVGRTFQTLPARRQRGTGDVLVGVFQGQVGFARIGAMPLKVGDRAPDFELPAVAGEKQFKVKLSDFRGKQHVVVTFHPLDWTPT